MSLDLAAVSPTIFAVEKGLTPAQPSSFDGLSRPVSKLRRIVADVTDYFESLFEYKEEDAERGFDKITLSHLRDSAGLGTKTESLFSALLAPATNPSLAMEPLPDNIVELAKRDAYLLNAERAETLKKEGKDGEEKRAPFSALISKLGAIFGSG